jgi:glycosyltransferase involved in cell wall biosynthesis
MTLPLTTVLVPAHNAEGTVRASVESALAQTVEDIQVVVVDDGSREPVAEVLGDLFDPRLQVLRHERNRGVSAARNTALSVARAPLVSQLDADDLWEPGYLEQILPAFEDPAIGLAYSNAYILRDTPGAETYLPGRAAIDVWVTDAARHPVDRFPDICKWCPICSPTVTARADAVRSVGGYAGWLPAGSDWHLYLKLARAGWRFAYVDQCLARYRWPEPERGMSYDLARRELMDLRLWSGFTLRHPATPGAARQLLHCVRRVVRRRVPVAETAYVALRGAARRVGHAGGRYAARGPGA